MAVDLRAELEDLAGPLPIFDERTLSRRAERNDRVRFTVAAAILAVAATVLGVLIVPSEGSRTQLLDAPTAAPLVPPLAPGEPETSGDQTPTSDGASVPVDVPFEQIAMDVTGIRAGALTYATTGESLEVQWDRYALPPPVPSVAWEDEIVLLFGSPEGCATETASVSRLGTDVSVQLRPTRACQREEGTTHALVLPRQELPHGQFTATVTSADEDHATVAVDPSPDDYAPIGALPSSGTGMADLVGDAPALAEGFDLTPTCAEISAFLGTSLPHLLDPPPRLGPPECALEAIDLGAPTPQPGTDTWFAHVVYLPHQSDVTRDSIHDIVAAGGLWYSVVFSTTGAEDWPATNLNDRAGATVAIEVDGGRGVLQRVADDRLRMTWRPPGLAGSAQYVILQTAVYDADTIVSLGRDTSLGEPAVEQATD